MNHCLQSLRWLTVSPLLAFSPTHSHCTQQRIHSSSRFWTLVVFYLVSGLSATTAIIRRKLKVIPYSHTSSQGSFCLFSPGSKGCINTTSDVGARYLECTSYLYLFVEEESIWRLRTFHCFCSSSCSLTPAHWPPQLRPGLRKLSQPTHLWPSTSVYMYVCSLSNFPYTYVYFYRSRHGVELRPDTNVFADSAKLEKGGATHTNNGFLARVVSLTAFLKDVPLQQDGGHHQKQVSSYRICVLGTSARLVWGRFESTSHKL